MDLHALRFSLNKIFSKVRKPYEYSFITEEKDTVRLLNLQPGPSGSLLKLELKEVKLSSRPKYHAISYVWGDSTRCVLILCNGAELLITQSLAAALQTIRDERNAINLWADQICINQNDVKERSQQVQFMNRIYREAQCVRVWLGDDKDGIAETAFQTIDRLHSLKLMGRGPDAVKEQKKQLKTYSLESWTSLRRLYKNPWFVRIWIGQEIGTEAPAQIHWAKATTDWYMLCPVSRFMYTEHYAVCKRFKLRAEKVTYLDRRYVEGRFNTSDRRTSFVYNLYRARKLQATDPRDRVFALLGHFSARTGPCGSSMITADYSKSLLQISCDLAAQIVRKAATLEILNVVLAKNDSADPNPSYPSWVPVWDFCEEVTVLIGNRETLFQASDNRLPRVSVSNSMQLESEGLKIDSVSFCSDALVVRHGGNVGESDNYRIFGQTRADAAKLCRQLWTNLSDRFNFSLGYPYINGESAVLAFCQTLSIGCQELSATIYVRSEYRNIPSKVWLMHGAAYLTYLFDGSTMLSDYLKELGSNGDAELWYLKAKRHCQGRRVFRTTNGYYGLGPSNMKKSDIVCVLFGGTTPYCLRPLENEISFRFIGECYVHGLMDGEAIEMMERGELSSKNFVIL